MGHFATDLDSPSYVAAAACYFVIHAYLRQKSLNRAGDSSVYLTVC